MKELTLEEIAGIEQAIHAPPPEKTPRGQIPLRPPKQFKKGGKVVFSPLQGDAVHSTTSLSEADRAHIADIQVRVDVHYGKTTLPLQHIMGLEKGSLLPLDQLCDELVDVSINGVRIARGEIVAIDDHYGVKIVALDA